MYYTTQENGNRISVVLNVIHRIITNVVSDENTSSETADDKL